MAHGHSEARNYPVPVVWTEVTLVQERANGLLASEISLLQLAVHSVLSKDAGAKLKKRLKDLVGD